MKTTGIKTLALFMMLMLGLQVQAQNDIEKQMVGNYKFHLVQNVQDDDMPMSVVTDGTISLNADHSAMREGSIDVLLPVEEDDYSNTFILTYSFKTLDETWKVEDGKLVNVVNDIDLKYVSAKAEKSDLIGSMFLGEITKQAPEMADGLKQSLLGTLTETIKSVDDKGIICVDDTDNEIVYSRQ